MGTCLITPVDRLLVDQIFVHGMCSGLSKLLLVGGCVKKVRGCDQGRG